MKSDTAQLYIWILGYYGYSTRISDDGFKPHDGAAGWYRRFYNYMVQPRSDYYSISSQRVRMTKLPRMG